MEWKRNVVSFSRPLFLFFAYYISTYCSRKHNNLFGGYLVFYLAAISHPDDTLGLRYSANRGFTLLCSPPFSLM